MLAFMRAFLGIVLLYVLLITLLRNKLFPAFLAFQAWMLLLDML